MESVRSLDHTDGESMDGRHGTLQDKHLTLEYCARHLQLLQLARVVPKGYRITLREALK